MNKLTRYASLQVIPKSEVEQQQQSFQLLQKRLGQTTPSEIESALATREQVEPEAELSGDVVARMQEPIKKRSRS
jgi:hypothetical protein